VIKKKLLIKNTIQKEYLDKSLSAKLSNNFKKIFKDIIKDIENKNNTLNILNKNFKFNLKINDLNKFKSFTNIAIIGMGGSILGAKAIYNFLNKKINKKLFFFDDLDSEKIKNFKKKENFNKTIFLIISKSGNTIETLTNIFSLGIIKRKSKNIILISEKKNNTLFLMSKKFDLMYIEHKSFIGGRYSVLSEVGIIPAYLMGVNIIRLRHKLTQFIANKENLILKDSTVKLANLLYKKKYSNLILLNYVPELEHVLYWCQQLIAESLGKKDKGFLPVVSNAPKDHHSLLQLYLDGPKDKIFNIFSLDEKNKEILNTKKISKKINFLHKKSINEIKTSQKNALIKALKKNKIPFREFKIKNIDEETLAQIFSYFILETVIIGKLIKINPFDQPSVEQVKIYTKKFLN
jgi:glucose-6-phosphate isomerase